MKHFEHLENKRIPSAWDKINVESGKGSWKRDALWKTSVQAELEYGKRDI